MFWIARVFCIMMLRVILDKILSFQAVAAITLNVFFYVNVHFIKQDMSLSFASRKCRT